MVGIEHKNLTNLCVMHAFNLINENTVDEKDLDRARPLSEYILIDRNKKFYSAWRLIHVIMCVITSYYYGFAASNS